MDGSDAAMQLGEQNTRAASGRPGRHLRPRAPTGARRAAAQRAAPLPEWSEAQRLAGERETLGLYLTGHPIAPYERGSARFASGPHRRFRRASGRAAPVEPAALTAMRAAGDLAGLIARGAAARPAGELHARRPQRPHGSDAVRGDLSAAPRADRQGRAGAGRGHAALRRVQRCLAAGRQADQRARRRCASGWRARCCSPGRAAADAAALLERLEALLRAVRGRAVPVLLRLPLPRPPAARSRLATSGRCARRASCSSSSRACSGAGAVRLRYTVETPAPRRRHGRLAIRPPGPIALRAGTVPSAASVRQSRRWPSASSILNNRSPNSRPRSRSSAM